MLEEVLTLALILSIATHALLVKKCQVLEASIPSHTAGVNHTMTEVRDLLDEALDMIGGLAPAPLASTPETPSSESLTGLILNTLLSRMSVPAEHETQQKDWEVLPPNDSPPTQAQD